MKNSHELRMKDLANLAGVSLSTVSRALSDSRQVSARTRQRIQQIARQYNYKLNVAARDLRANTTRTIKVVVPTGDSGLPHVSDPFVIDLIASVADTLSDLNYSMLLSKVSFSVSSDVIETLVDRNVDGIIVLGQRRFHSALNDLDDHDVPVVVFGARLPEQRYVTVGSDNIKGAR